MHSYGEGRDKSCDYSNFFGVNMIHRNHILYFSDNFVTTITNIFKAQKQMPTQKNEYGNILGNKTGYFF